MKANNGMLETSAAKQHRVATAKISRRFVRLPQVKTMTALSKASIYKRMNAKQFPKSIKLGLRVTVWLEDEIENWIDDKANATRY